MHDDCDEVDVEIQGTLMYQTSRCAIFTLA